MSNVASYGAPRAELKILAGTIGSGGIDGSLLRMWLSELAKADFDGDWPSQQPDLSALKDIPVAVIKRLADTCNRPDAAAAIHRWLSNETT